MISDPRSAARDAFVEALQAKLKEWDAVAARLTSKANRRSLDSLLLDDLLQRQAAAHEWLDEVRQSEDEVWPQLRKQASVAGQDYEEVLERAVRRLRTVSAGAVGAGAEGSA